MQNMTQVEAKMGLDGLIRPTAFMWQDRLMKVMSWGRRWEKEGRRHFLVMTAGDQIWELRLAPAAMTWSIHPKSQPLRAV